LNLLLDLQLIRGGVVMKLIKISYTIVLIVLVQQNLLAQSDSLVIKSKHHHLGLSMIVPAALITSGFIVKESSFRKSFQDDIQNSNWRTNNHVDDFIQYFPMAEMYIADIAYSKTKIEVFQQSKNLIISQLFTAIIIQTIKRTTNNTRPNGSPHSFPSGHTSIAFTGATALYLEYRDTNPFLAYSGYGFSTATGLLRITNNKHWLSDVLVGAGIGMVSAQLTWYINPLKNWNPYKNSKVAIIPYINGFDSSAGFCVVF
jgi:hypothetical protein